MPVEENVNLKLLTLEENKKNCIVLRGDGHEYEAKYNGVSFVSFKNIASWFCAPEVSVVPRKHLGLSNKLVFMVREVKKVTMKKADANPSNASWISVKDCLNKENKILRVRVECKVLFCVAGSTKLHRACIQDLHDEKRIMFVHSDDPLSVVSHSAIGFIKRFSIGDMYFIEDGLHETVMDDKEVSAEEALVSFEEMKEGRVYTGVVKLIDTTYVKIAVPKEVDGSKYKLSPRKKQKAEDNVVDYQVDFLCYSPDGSKEEFKLRFSDPVLKKFLRESDRMELESKHWSDQSEHLKELFGVELTVKLFKMQGQFHACEFMYNK